jgi:hypothetical protein
MVLANRAERASGAHCPGAVSFGMLRLRYSQCVAFKSIVSLAGHSFPLSSP